MRNIKMAFGAWILCALALSGCSATSAETAFVLAEEEAQPVVADQGEATGASGLPEAAVSEADPPAEIMVHVCGAVNRAGVYTLEAGSRVCQAVAAAGGFAPDADESFVNQAEILADGVRLRIPTVAETALQPGEGDFAAEAAVPAAISGGSGAEAGSFRDAAGKININTADAETLCRLNGVGTSTAAKIIAYREANGSFSRIEDIMQVSGIKSGLFAKIREDITV